MDTWLQQQLEDSKIDMDGVHSIVSNQWEAPYLYDTMETWLQQQIEDSKIDMDGFHSIVRNQ